MVRVESLGPEYTTKRVYWKGSYRVFAWKKGRRGVVTHKAWARDRRVWESRFKKAIAEKEVIYRSSMVYTYAGSTKDGPVDYRVWVYSEKPVITLDDLKTWITKLSIAFSTLAKLDEDVSGRELNEGMTKGDMDREGASFDEWRGFAVFENKYGKQVKYYAKQVGSQFVQVNPFTMPKLRGGSVRV